MKPGSSVLLAKAERAATAAAAALDGGGPEAAAARAFYAMLYAAKVLLNEHGVRLRAHRRIASGLARVSLGESLPLAEWLTSAIERRQRKDVELTDADAACLVERAHQFVAAARAHLS